MKRFRTRGAAKGIDATVGYGANDRGDGVAYVRAVSGAGEQLVRVPFRVKRLAGLGGREVGYGALRAVLRALREWDVRRVRLAVEDPQLVEQLDERSDVPPPMVLPYVRLRCELNAFDDAVVTRAAESDLTQRARAEAAVSYAA